MEAANAYFTGSVIARVQTLVNHELIRHDPGRRSSQLLRRWVTSHTKGLFVLSDEEATEDVERVHLCEGCPVCSRQLLPLHEQVRAAKRAMGLTTKKLGELTKLGSTYISKIELGIYKPSINSLQKMSRALGVAFVIGDETGWMSENFDLGLQKNKAHIITRPGISHGTYYAYGLGCRCVPCVAKRQRNRSKERYDHKKPCACNGTEYLCDDCLHPKEKGKNCIRCGSEKIINCPVCKPGKSK